MNVLDLFSGIGGFSLGLGRAGFRTVAFCEIDLFCCSVLKKHWPDIPIHKDIRELNGEQYRGTVDLVCGGFPCQPFSHAGNRAGAGDDRALWPEMFRVIQEVQPAWIIGENVPGVISMELDNMLSNLEGAGYSCQTFIIPACAVDAPHRRDRVWVLASNPCYLRSAEQKRQHERPEIHNGGSANPVGSRQALADPTCCYDGSRNTGETERQEREFRNGSSKNNMANTDPERLQKREILARSEIKKEQKHTREALERVHRWPIEPGVDRVVNGFPGRVDRIKGLGNAVIPDIPEMIGRAIQSEAQK